MTRRYLTPLALAALLTVLGAALILPNGALDAQEPAQSEEQDSEQQEQPQEPEQEEPGLPAESESEGQQESEPPAELEEPKPEPEYALSVRIASWRSSEDVLELCIGLRDPAAGDARQCPSGRNLTVADAPRESWLRSRSLFIAPEVELWARARLVGERIDLGLGTRIEGEVRLVRGASWSLDWPETPAEEWLQTTTITLQLPVAPHPELWGDGIHAGVRRLEEGRPASEFTLPKLAGGCGENDGDGEANEAGGEGESGEESGENEDIVVRYTLSAALSCRDYDVAVLVFWSTWAPYAAETLATLSSLSESEPGLLVVSINVYESPEDVPQDEPESDPEAESEGEPEEDFDESSEDELAGEEPEESSEDVPQAEPEIDPVTFVEQHAPTILHLQDSEGEVARHYRVDGLPEFYLIDSEGIYQGVIRGAAPTEEIQAAIAEGTEPLLSQE